MAKKVVLVGHCGADASYLRLALARAYHDASVSFADDESELRRMIEQGVDLLLMNRVIDYGFETDEGVELIRRLRAEFPQLKMMLVSNYPDAQQQAIAAGAMPGFGKRDLGKPHSTAALKSALSDETGA